MWKYIAGFFTLVIGGLLAFLSGKSAGRKDEKFKNINTQIKDVEKSLKKRQKDKNGYKKTLKSKKKALEEIKKQKYNKKNVTVKEASDFLKKYAKKKK